MSKLKIDDMTLIGVDGYDIDRLIKAANVCSYYVDVTDIKVLSNIEPIIEYDKSRITYVKVESIPSINDYSRFMIKRINEYVNTKNSIIFQYDGFILNPDAWSDEFLQYDYIGAPWNDGQVGNGGFSLRSRRLLEELANNNDIPNPEDYQHEDGIIATGYWHDNILIPKGFKFPSTEIANRFAIERVKWEGSFGFHSFASDITEWKDLQLFKDK